MSADPPKMDRPSVKVIMAWFDEIQSKIGSLIRIDHTISIREDDNLIRLSILISDTGSKLDLVIMTEDRIGDITLEAVKGPTFTKGETRRDFPMGHISEAQIMNKVLKAIKKTIYWLTTRS